MAFMIHLPLESQGLHPGDAAVPMVRAWTDAGHGVGLPRVTWVMVKGSKTHQVILFWEVFVPHGFIYQFSIFRKILDCLPQSIAYSSLRYP